MTEFDLDRAWRVGAGVALRPERFGALAYSFNSRRLSFLKSRRLYEIVRTLAEYPSGRAACEAAGAAGTELAQLRTALGTLAATGMIEERVA
ncbi:MAG TPA: mycofactocin biosynthesis chaperone MftB [Solirubrobacteraceae bacterium]|nr:mycofactocin biosynthesis chaperone MftB [Solirubrobacteraceae bacterium]